MSASGSQINLSELNFDDDGLIPCVIQDADTKDVLMLGYMNQESLSQTLDTRLVTFWSRSRKRIWVKGESSGNQLQFVKAHIDCDSDAILIQAKPIGPTCHTGNISCFDGVVHV